jgi:hypothetical protein
MNKNFSLRNEVDWESIWEEELFLLKQARFMIQEQMSTLNELVKVTLIK